MRLEYFPIDYVLMKADSVLSVPHTMTFSPEGFLTKIKLTTTKDYFGR